MSKYLIIGNGFLGNKFKEFLGDEAVLNTDRICSLNDISVAIARNKPDVIINCAGKTGKPNIDWCEENKVVTLESNVELPLLINKACIIDKVKFVQISTGCIYYNLTGKLYAEDDEPDFTDSYYSKTKYHIEKLLSDYNILQLRIRMPMTNKPEDKNIITKLVNYKHVIHIPNSMSYIPHFLTAARELINRDKTGIWNIVNKGGITHPDILDMYKEIIDPNFSYEIISLCNMYEKYVNVRRSNCVLSVEKLERERIYMPEIRPTVLSALLEYRKHVKIDSNATTTSNIKDSDITMTPNVEYINEEKA